MEVYSCFLGMNPFRFLLFFAFSSVSILLYGQKVKDVCGEYIYYAPENVTLEQARQTALYRARLTALADEFGTLITQNNVTNVKNVNGKSDVSFLSFGESEVKGEWLEDTGKPAYTVSYDENTLVVKVSVCGKAREIISAGVEFMSKVLKNGMDERFETSEFMAGDDMYLAFRAPIDGYVAVYLVDESKTVYCLLPYRTNSDGKVFVKAHQDYLFFSKSSDNKLFEASQIDEYTLTCEKGTEHNFLYIIFSSHPFIKANDRKAESEKNGLLLPRKLLFEDFQKWLTKNRMHDKEMRIEIKDLTITK